MEARPTVYKGVQMRSRLEAGFAAWLDRRRIRWAYEPKAFADETGQYLPDFVLQGLQEIDPLYVDVKPIGFDIEETKRRMQIIWASEPNAYLTIASPDDRCYWGFPLGMGENAFSLASFEEEIEQKREQLDRYREVLGDEELQMYMPDDSHASYMIARWQPASWWLCPRCARVGLAQRYGRCPYCHLVNQAEFMADSPWVGRPYWMGPAEE